MTHIDDSTPAAAHTPEPWDYDMDFAGPEQFEARLRAFLEDYNSQQAHPYRWTYTGQPLVRGTPFSATRRQQRRGRAWFGQRPLPFDRALYPPRPYKRQVT